MALLVYFHQQQNNTNVDTDCFCIGIFWLILFFINTKNVANLICFLFVNKFCGYRLAKQEILESKNYMY